MISGEFLRESGSDGSPPSYCRPVRDPSASSGKESGSVCRGRSSAAKNANALSGWTSPWGTTCRTLPRQESNEDGKTKGRRRMLGEPVKSRSREAKTPASGKTRRRPKTSKESAKPQRDPERSAGRLPSVSLSGNDSCRSGNQRSPEGAGGESPEAVGGGFSGGGATWRTKGNRSFITSSTMTSTK